MKVYVAVHERPQIQAELTTDHAASSYDQPVLIIDGVAYGPGDHYHRWPLVQVSAHPFESGSDLALDLDSALTHPDPRPEPPLVRQWIESVVRAHRQVIADAD